MSPPRKMPEWAYNQMIEGLQKLLVLRLSGAPPADTVTALAAVWEEALTPYTWYYDKGTDGRRLPQAFAAVVQAADKWVQPAHKIGVVPTLAPERLPAQVHQRPVPFRRGFRGFPFTFAHIRQRHVRFIHAVFVHQRLRVLQGPRR